MSYKKAGVDIDKGNEFVSYVKKLAARTGNRGVISGIGGFAGVLDMGIHGMHDPVMLTSTDGVGTKLLIADDMKIYDTLGIDLVAMCVNDIIAHGAKPAFFSDYLALANLSSGIAESLIKGIVEGCRLADTSLVGGETAEMPAVYSGGGYDMAGFVIGFAERNLLLPHVQNIHEGDIILGVFSSGLHSNGFSLVRNIIGRAEMSYYEECPWNENCRLGELFLTPTIIYTDLLKIVKQVKAMAHITGGGLIDNVPRILPRGLTAIIDCASWVPNAVFSYLYDLGDLQLIDMYRVFNMGIGMAVIVDKVKADEVSSLIGVDRCCVIGHIAKGGNVQLVRCSDNVFVE